jgi:Ca2+/Na+ antiporter
LLLVGIGALAGSTIMLLTIPWFLSILGGRVNLDPQTGLPNYRNSPKLYPKDNYSLTGTGITLNKVVNSTAYIVLFTAIGYFLLQVPGLVYLHKTTAEQAEGERNWVILGFILAVCFFCGYLFQQYKNSLPGSRDIVQQILQEEFLRNAIATGKISLSGFMVDEYDEFCKNHPSTTSGNSYEPTENTRLKSSGGSGSGSGSFSISDEFITYLERILRPFFKVYDKDNNDSIDNYELTTLFKDLGENLSAEEIQKIFNEFDIDKNGSIDYKEFVRGTAKYIFTHKHLSTKGLKGRNASVDRAIRDHVSASNKEDKNKDEQGEGGDDDDEDEEVPDDMKDLSPEEQQKRIKFRSFTTMALGTFIVLFFSDPMVDILSEVGTRTGIPSFYIAFVAAPLASNASELIAAYNYAQKKTVATITISLTTLEGAAVMNNTFVLGKFCYSSCLSLIS